ncbi:hypothetical protein [Arenibaculum pallidiluteum]|uniref:hypothetical protein n=1 Tax=Arenibaculum pallidiluteum TaxID=2812559 RepID=UPI001A96DBEA|nr:hypothetical protein [Arenibaculum pallidiluteum]
MAAKLSRAQIAHLVRIDAGGSDGLPAAGYTGSAAEMRLAMLGLIRAWSVDVPLGIGALSTRIRFAELTEEGHKVHAALGLPLSERDADFLARPGGVCREDDARYRTAAARGHVHPVARFEGCVVWERTPAGAAALDTHRPESPGTTGRS